MKITIDFDNGVTREYELHEGLASALLDGENVSIEFCHPNHGEQAIIKVGNPHDS